MGFSHLYTKSLIVYPQHPSQFCRGHTHTPFPNQRGIRQGDTLSPILFDLIMDVLTWLIENKVELKQYDAYQVNGCISITHLMYVAMLVV